MSWREKTYDELPALGVRGPELRRSMERVTEAYVYFVVWMVCIGGSQMKVFARMTGFGERSFGIMTAIPFIATLGQLVAAILIERTGLRKFQFLGCLIPGRALWLVVVLVPFVLPVPSTWAVAAVLVVLLVSWSLSSLAFPAWFSWMGDLIPRRIRGRYLASRLRVGRAVQIPVVIAVGLILDAVTNPNLPETYAAQPVLLWTTCGIILIGALCGVRDIFLFYRIREVLPTTPDLPRAPAIRIDVAPPRGRTPAGLTGYAVRYTVRAVKHLLLEPLRDRLFRRYVFYGATMTFAMTVSGWFCWLFCLETAGFSKLATNVAFMVVIPIAVILSSRAWGIVIDRWGRRPTLILATVCTVFSIMPYFFMDPSPAVPTWLLDGSNALAAAAGSLVGRPEWVWVTPETPVGAYLLLLIGMVLGGSGWTAIQLAQTGIVMGFSDGEGRSKYVASSAVLISIGGIVGGLVGGNVAHYLKFLEDAPIVVGPFLWTNFHGCFALSWGARIVAVLLLIGMPDPGSTPVRHVLRHISINVYNSVAPRLFMPLRVFGWAKRRRK